MPEFLGAKCGKNFHLVNYVEISTVNKIDNEAFFELLLNNSKMKHFKDLPTI